MFEQVFDQYRKAAESALQAQQELYRQWARHWAAVPGAFAEAGWNDPIQAFQKRWSESVTALVNKYREDLDARYQAGIKVIEQAFRTAEAKNPEEFRKLVEELWRKNLEFFRDMVETQMRDFQAAMEKWLEGMTTTAKA